VTLIGASASKNTQPINQPAPQSQQQGNVLGGPQTPPYNPHTPFPPQVDSNGNPVNNNENDDLPF
jgi:hypothetical protein